jgi:uncharacterized Zn finger protein
MPNYNKKIEVSCPNCGIKRLARGDVVRKALKERDEFWCLPCRNRTRVHLPRKYVGTKQERNSQATKAWREGNPDKVLDKRYKERYGITYTEYKAMSENQNYKCKICGVDEKKLVVDHNHQTLKIRGLLCNNCNCAIGLLKDNVETLKSAVNYLKSVVE